MKRHGDSSGRGKGARREPLQVGQKIRDNQQYREGVIVDYACQYTHPQAQPIFNYLVRWQEGQITALGESAIRSNFGIEVLDE